MISLRTIGISCKEQLQNNDINAVTYMNKCLQQRRDDSFVKIILELEIPHHLLNLLMTSNYVVNLKILKCLEQLCFYKIFHTSDYPIKTANFILKTLFHLETRHGYDNVVIESLKIITIIIENLDDYNNDNKQNLKFHHYLDTVKNLLHNKEDCSVLNATIKMFSTLLLYKGFQMHIDNNILSLIESLWKQSLEKLSQMYNNDMKSCVIGVSKLCDSTLRMLTNLLLYKQQKVTEFYTLVRNNAISCLKFVCIPYIQEFGLKSNDIYAEYLCFLKTLLLSNLQQDILVEISHQLINKLTFNVIVRYIARTSHISNSEQQNNTRSVVVGLAIDSVNDFAPICSRELCLMILCEIIGNVNRSNCLANGNVFKKHLFKTLQTVLHLNINGWLILIRNREISVDTKLVIIKFSSVYYISANNLHELQPSHLDCLIEFLKNYSPSEAAISRNYLKDLWLLFAVICCYYSEEKCNNYALYRAIATLQTLIFTHKHSFDEIITFHPSIISWVFLVPGIKKELISAVTNKFLLRSQTSPNTASALLYAVANIKGAAFFLLDCLVHGTLAEATIIVDVLRSALACAHLAQNPEFVAQLHVAVLTVITNLEKSSVSKESVIYSIYIFHLASCADIPSDRHLVDFSIRTVASYLGTLGFLNTLPIVFYSSAFDYISSILAAAKIHQITKVFLNLINCGTFICTLLAGFLSDNLELSIRAAKILHTLLEYQIHHRLYCKDTILIKKENIVNLLKFDKNVEILQLNLQIFKLLFSKTTKTLLDLESDEKILKGVYLRCQILVSKPVEDKLVNHGLKCMESLLRYVHINNFECREQLYHHPGNHVMILMYYDKETRRSFDRSFLSFIHCWLQFASKNKEKLYDKLSITSNLWRMSLTQITELIQGEAIEKKSDNNDIINNILKQLFQFINILPMEQVRYLKKVEERLISY